MEENKKKRVVDIKPLGKGRRILVFLGDFFITFILGFLLFTVAAYPIAKVAVNYDQKNAQVNEILNETNDMLVDSGFMFYPPESKNLPKTFENAVNYTFDVFISYYLYDEETPLSSNPQLGHKIENEVIRKYYVDYKNDSAKYLEIFNRENAKNNYFNIGETPDSIHIKPEYKESFKLQFEETKDGNYSTDLINIRDNVFARLFYVGMYLDIQENDLVIGEKSFNSLLKQVESINNVIDWSTTIGCGASLLIATALVYLVYPLIQKDRRTPTMSILKVDRLLINNFNFIKRKNVWLQYVFHFAMCSGAAIFYPFIIYGIPYCFNLPLLVNFLFISVGLMLVSLVVLLINQFNRSGTDILSFCVLVPTSEIDKIYSTDEVFEWAKKN